jgi:uncharacterized OsmC-like protein
MVDLVWDGQRGGTVVGPGGAMLGVGSDSALSPLDLVGSAASSCLMQAFLGRLARAGVVPLGSVLAARVERARTVPRLRVYVLVILSSEARQSDAQVSRWLAAAWRESPVCRMLGNRLMVETEVRRLGPDEAA